MEYVADKLLDLAAHGGSQVQRALQWGGRQLAETSTELKICFLLTDCQFFEQKNQTIKELETFINQKLKLLLGVNTRSFSKKYADLILEKTQGKIVYILKIINISKVLMEVLEQIG